MKIKVKGIKARIAEWVIALIVGIISIGVAVASVAVGVHTYNHRYDASAKAAQGLEFTLSNNKDSGAGTITMSAGRCTYGYFQKSGKVNTKYVLKKKKTEDSSYSTLKSEFTIFENNNYEGAYLLASSKYSQSYDIKLEKKNNKSNETVFEIDFGIE